MKSVEAYKRGDFEQALKDAFNGFDSTLTDVAVVAELEKLAINVVDGNKTESSRNGGDMELSIENDLNESDLMDTRKECKNHPVIETVSGAKQPVRIHQLSPDSSLDNDEEGELLLHKICTHVEF